MTSEGIEGPPHKALKVLKRLPARPVQPSLIRCLTRLKRGKAQHRTGPAAGSIDCFVTFIARQPNMAALNLLSAESNHWPVWVCTLYVNRQRLSKAAVFH